MADNPPAGAIPVQAVIEKLVQINREMSLETLDLETYEQMVNFMPSGLIVINEAQRIIYVNEQTRLIFGYPSSQLLGQPVHMLLAPELAARHEKHIATFFEHPSTRPMNMSRGLSGRTKSGRDIAVQINIGPLVGPNGILAMASIRQVPRGD